MEINFLEPCLGIKARFDMSIKEAIQYMIYTKALELIKYMSEEDVKKKRHELLVKNPQIKD